jgi:hypothetical protein
MKYSVGNIGVEDIDVVITWVDNSDPIWKKQYELYEKSYSQACPTGRYRNFDNLQYIFRGIETFMPWVRKIHLITCGHVPK